LNFILFTHININIYKFILQYCSIYFFLNVVFANGLSIKHIRSKGGGVWIKVNGHRWEGWGRPSTRRPQTKKQIAFWSPYQSPKPPPPDLAVRIAIYFAFAIYHAHQQNADLRGIYGTFPTTLSTMFSSRDTSKWCPRKQNVLLEPN